MESILIPPAPEWIIRVAGQARRKEPDRGAPRIDWDEPQSVLKAVEYARIAEPSIEGRGGDSNAYRVSCRMRDLGVSETVCLQILSGEWNNRCCPPWSFEDLEAKVANAYQYAGRPAGNAAPAVVASRFEDLEMPESKKAAPPMPFSIHELEGAPPERKWIVKDWLPMGEVSSLYGDGGIGKTLIAQQLGFCVSYGLPFLGMDTSKMPVFAALAEDDRDEVHRRIQQFRIAHFMGSPNKDAVFQIFSFPSEDYTLARENNGKLTAGPFHKRLISFLEVMPAGAKLVVLDTLADMFDGNENARGLANHFIKNVLRRICVKFDATILLLAHPSRAGMANSDNLSGSTAWNNAVRNRLTLVKHETYPDVRVLTRVKSNYAKSGETISLYWQTGTFVPITEESALDASAQMFEELVIRKLQEAAEVDAPYIDTQTSHPRYLYKASYLKAFRNGKENINKELLRQIIERLVQEGKVVRRVKEKHKNGLFPASFCAEVGER